MFVKPKPPKKQKAEVFISPTKGPQLDETLKPVKEIMNKESFILTYDQLLNFFDNSQKNTDVLSVAERYINDIGEVITILTFIYPNIKDKSMKSRWTKIRNKLTKQLVTPDCNTTSDSESDVPLTQ